jgi:hypothetical protein
MAVTSYAEELLGSNVTELIHYTWGDHSFNPNAIPSTPFESFWIDCYLRFGEFWFILVVYSFMIVCYILGGLFCAAVDYSRVIFQYKIQPDVIFNLDITSNKIRNIQRALAIGSVYRISFKTMS